MCTVILRREPVAGTMAISARSAQQAAVIARFTVAGSTCGRRSFENTPYMALQAIHTCVRPRKGERCLAVIKGHPIPSVWSVALAAGGTELATVIVIPLVAGVAILWRTLEDTVDMAALAVYRLVPAHQSKSCLVVAPCDLLPALRGVARVAV